MTRVVRLLWFGPVAAKMQISPLQRIKPAFGREDNVFWNAKNKLRFPAAGMTNQAEEAREGERHRSGSTNERSYRGAWRGGVCCFAD